MTGSWRTLVDLVRQDEVWEPCEGRRLPVSALDADQRAGVQVVLDWLAPAIYATFQGGDPTDPLGHWGRRGPDPEQRAEARRWLQHQPLLRRLQRLAPEDCEPRLLDLLDQAEYWRSRRGLVLIDTMHPRHRATALILLRRAASDLFGDWLVESRPEERVAAGLGHIEPDRYEYDDDDAQSWLAGRPLTRRLRLPPGRRRPPRR